MNCPAFIGDWCRERSLGTGGFGTVILWRNNKSKLRVAIKMCHEILPSNELIDKQKQRWQQEVDLMTNKINCENIVKSLRITPESFVDELNRLTTKNMPVLVMEYCDGGDLRFSLNKISNTSGLRESKIRNILKSIGNAISYLHQQKITHRDIKPENIVIKTDDNSDKLVYKLTDLGLAKGLDYDSLQASRVGTIEYVAPEMFIQGNYSCTVDYWSFGIIAFEIITGQRPFVPHLPLVQWLLAVREKKSKHISITGDIGDIKYETTIFPEVHISKTFRGFMEQWLRLALEWNPKQRGYIFETKINEVSADSHTDDRNKQSEPQPVAAPTKILKIFSLLSDILSKKILTIFCLQSMRHWSYEIDKNTTMEWLIRNIETDLKIPKDKIYFIQTLDNLRELIQKPIDFYLEEYFDKPMVYVTKRDLKFNLHNIQLETPKSVQDVLDNREIKMNLHQFRKFAHDTLYFIRNEQEKYINYANGYEMYSLKVNDDITKHEKNVCIMTKLIYGLDGALKLYHSTLQQTQEELSDECPEFRKSNWSEQYDKLMLKVNKIVTACEQIQRRYRSALRRSNESVLYKPLLNYNATNKDIFGVQKLEQHIMGIRTKLTQKIKLENREIYIHIFQFINDYLKLLHDDKEFIKWRENTIKLDLEMFEIKKVIELATIEAEKYREEISAANSSLQKVIRNFIKKSKLISGPPDGLSLPDLEAILDNKAKSSIDFKIGHIVTCDLFDKKYQKEMDFNRIDDTATVIEINESLRTTLDKFKLDIDQEISDSSSKT